MHHHNLGLEGQKRLALERNLIHRRVAVSFRIDSTLGVRFLQARLNRRVSFGEQLGRWQKVLGGQVFACLPLRLFASAKASRELDAVIQTALVLVLKHRDLHGKEFLREHGRLLLAALGGRRCSHFLAPSSKTASLKPTMGTLLDRCTAGLATAELLGRKRRRYGGAHSAA